VPDPTASDSAASDSAASDSSVPNPVPTPDGSGLQEFLAVMNRLRSPGGCPWDAEQTHRSLLPHLLEEAHEVVEAVESGSRADLLEELGDLLLQVVFHARIAQEDPEEPFDIDDIARGISAKLQRRHPYVFPEAADPQVNVIKDGVTSIADQEVTWESAKAAEKQRESVFDGIPLALSPLMRAQKVLKRARRAGLTHRAEFKEVLISGESGDQAEEPSSLIGKELLEVVRRAQSQGVDAEGALREAVRDLETQLRDRERSGDGSAEHGPQT